MLPIAVVFVMPAPAPPITLPVIMRASEIGDEELSDDQKERLANDTPLQAIWRLIGIHKQRRWEARKLRDAATSPAEFKRYDGTAKAYTLAIYRLEELEKLCSKK